MHRIIGGLVGALAVALTTAPASEANVCSKAYTVRAAVVHKHGKRAPGRNICRFGVKLSNGKVTDATYGQKKRYLFALRRLNGTMPYLATRAVAPAQRPAGTLTAAYAPSGLASCIVHHESGGDPTAVNGIYTGIAQWSPEAWARMGGHRYAPSPLGASYQEQLQVLSDGLSHYGCRDWCPYDPC